LKRKTKGIDADDSSSSGSDALLHVRKKPSSSTTSANPDNSSKITKTKKTINSDPCGSLKNIKKARTDISPNREDMDEIMQQLATCFQSLSSRESKILGEMIMLQAKLVCNQDDRTKAKYNAIIVRAIDMEPTFYKLTIEKVAHEIVLKEHKIEAVTTLQEEESKRQIQFLLQKWRHNCYPNSVSSPARAVAYMFRRIKF